MNKMNPMQIFQTSLELPAFPRGYHLVTRKIEEACDFLAEIEAGILHVFIQHTSASLTINENADPSVRVDFRSHFDVLVPENEPHYTHTQEGSDDMPAHLKAALLGNSLQIPITKGSLNLGTWQGIYLCEHRNHGGRRRLVLTAYGSSR
ncbi:secondary thiamine-phosphate synthase enzyme YjbQ [Nafulsella turpanensis]|uniref:secondary thiamine-phosphate synthase enzyme YjbQ n=1 Tax=Nafulsella turpanensis TaxID=1265690 RepID=UPI00034CF8B2